MTYTIAVSVPEKQLLGLATASRSLAVGAGVLALRAGVGAVASQAYTNRSLRTYALSRLESGDSPQQIVDSLPAVDSRSEIRQLAIIDAQGRHASYTGEACSAHVASASSEGAVAVGNLLAGPHVIAEMMESYRRSTTATTPEELGAALLQALSAGDAAGGDIRGRQSAALIVTRAGVTEAGLPYDDIDLRVDDHDDPVAELRRLFDLQLGTQ